MLVFCGSFKSLLYVHEGSIMKHFCEGCGAETWAGQDLCPDCEMLLRERRAEERLAEEKKRKIKRR